MTETQTILKPQNLRVGNWLLHNNKPFEVIDIGAYVDADSGYDGWLIGAVRIEELQPIELSPEILEKAGFMKRRETNVSGMFEYSYYPSITMNKSYSVLLTEKNGEYGVFKNLKLIGRTRIKHLHQLQNLFYSLTGTELEIDL